jgi:uncharacterized membrane protein
MAWFWWLLGVLILILWIAAIVDIIRKRHSRSVGKTVAWILLIIILPILGTIIYFLVNGAGGPAAPRSAEMDRMTGERY